MKSGEGHHVHSELAEVSIQLARKTEAGRHTYGLAIIPGLLRDDDAYQTLSWIPNDSDHRM